MRTSRVRLPWLYLVLAYAFAWVVWIPVALTGQDYQSSPLLLVTVLVGVFGPGLAGALLPRGGISLFTRHSPPPQALCG